MRRAAALHSVIESSGGWPCNRRWAGAEVPGGVGGVVSAARAAGGPGGAPTPPAPTGAAPGLPSW